jgi:hypothetical protein
MNIIQLLITILCFSHVLSNSIQIQKFRNNLLSIYIQAYNKEKQKINIKNLYCKLYNKVYDKINIYLNQFNNDYYTLSYDERTLLENLAPLMY